MANQKNKLESDVDALFQLPLAEFIVARNALASQLKKEKRVNEADFVKTLVKPSVSAWAVNQLYWEHRKEFDRLIDTGERLQKLQSSRGGGKVADMRTALDQRRETLSQLAHLASELLSAAGHSPSPDTVHRVTTTLEAMSAYASSEDGPRAGRLTQDVDPPGFDSLAAWVPSGGAKQAKSPAAAPPKKVESISNKREIESARQAKITEAKVSLKEAKSVLSETRIRAQRTEAAQKRAQAEAKEADERFRKARAEAEEAAKALKDAERNVEKASRELEGLLDA